ncbi:MAG TPA: cell division protein FtsA [Candidatus Elarobacter sp.]|jgi:cell division protein FtsA|nr:cell division protein FtsA [Candidatus Elarobacter sp.]
MARGETIAGLDIGTTKTCVVIATSGTDGVEIIGIGEAPSTGMRKGVVTDLEATVHAIEAATEKAERMAGVHVSHVYVGVTGEHVQSTNNRGVVAVTGEDREVINNDVKRVVDASKIINLAADRQIIHSLPRHYTIDGQDGVTDPVGMSGGRLEVDTHIVTGGSSFISNVLKCVHRAGLEPVAIVFEPLASAAATLLPEEKQVGVVLLDIGGGTTDIAVYSDGGVLHSATVPVGGNILSNDISLGLKTTFAEAENVKRTYGSGVSRPDESEQTFQVKTLDGRSTREVTSSQLRSIVLPRVLEILRLAKDNVVQRIPRDQVLSEIVLTGGTAHLRGIETTAADVFGLPVRIGVPATVGGLTDAVKQPEYATAIGLVLFGPRGEHAPHLNGHSTGPFAKLWSWFASIWN